MQNQSNTHPTLELNYSGSNPSIKLGSGSGPSDIHFGRHSVWGPKFTTGPLSKAGWGGLRVSTTTGEHDFDGGPTGSTRSGGW